MRKDGTQKTTKTGRAVFMTVTVVDKTKPKPNLKCDFRGCDIDGGEILPGTPYMHISPKSGPYGGRQLNRHQAHPAWNVWEYSSSMSARLAQIAHDFWEAIRSTSIWSTCRFSRVRRSKRTSTLAARRSRDRRFRRIRTKSDGRKPCG